MGIPPTAPLTPGAGLFSGEGVGGGLPHALVVAASLVATHESRGAAPPLQVAVTTSLVSRGCPVWGQDRPVGSRCSGGIPSCDSPPSLPAPSLPAEVDGGPERGCAYPGVAGLHSSPRLYHTCCLCVSCREAWCRIPLRPELVKTQGAMWSRGMSVSRRGPCSLSVKYKEMHGERQGQGTHVCPARLGGPGPPRPFLGFQDGRGPQAARAPDARPPPPPSP